MPRADLVLFITSADRPFTESERIFLAQIKAWGKKVVLVINKTDIFETEADLQKVITFVTENGTMLLETTPDIFPVSARDALRAKLGQPQLWQSSGFEPLEAYIHATLDEAGRLRLKFLNPLGVGERLLNSYHDITQNRLSLLAEDTQTLENLERQLNLYQQDMQRDFEFRLSDIENVLHDMEKRGNAYFDETMRVARIFDLMKKERIRQEFEQQVVANLPEDIEQKVNALIDWLVQADLKQWHAVMEYLAQRKEEHKKRIVGEVGGSFRYDREHLLDSVGKSAQRVVETYNVSAESQKLAKSAQMAVAETAAAEAGAIGIGALITALATTAAVDVTGILAAGVVAALGLFVIPARRQGAKKDMAQRLAALREQLTAALTDQFNKELEAGINRIDEAVAPYTRFVRSEQENLSQTKAALTQLQTTQSRLRAEIEALT